MNPRTRVLLQGPIVPTLLRMAWPNVLVMFAQAATGLIETYWVGKLGTDALAGMALVFPGVMLMQMFSAGAMGGGISSAIARALGAGKREQADALVLHALVINLLIGAAFTVAMLMWGRPLYRLLGGEGASLEAALIYSNIVFGGIVLLWVMNALASVIRGTGNMLVPALVICAGAILLVPLSPLLIFGLGPIPALGIAGGGVALAALQSRASRSCSAGISSPAATSRASGSCRCAGRWRARSCASARSRASARCRPTSPSRPSLRWSASRPDPRLSRASARRRASNICWCRWCSVSAAAGGAGRHQYRRGKSRAGAAGRLDRRGNRFRALRERSASRRLSTRTAWLSLFDRDPRMIEAGSAYLRAVGPFYGCFGFGLALYFASQGAGRLLWPLIFGFARMAVAIGGGWLVLKLTGSLPAMFLAVGIALAVYGAGVALAVWLGAWFPRRA